MSLTLAAIGGIVAAIVKYLIASKGAEIAGQKALEKVGESGGEAIIKAGEDSFHRIEQILTKRKADESTKKVNKAFMDIEEDPEDKQYQEKLAIELEKLAIHDQELSKLLQSLSSTVRRAELHIEGDVQGSVSASDNAKIYGASVGVNTGSIDIGGYNVNDIDKDEHTKGNTSR